jgi:hypothetical protein
MKLNDKGQCCGRKPLVYKTNRHAGYNMPRHGYLFCWRCDRAYDRDTHEQIPNWAYKMVNGEWEVQKGKA